MVRQFATGSPSGQAKLQHLRYESYDGSTLRLAVDASEPGQARWLASQTKELASIVQQATGVGVKIELATPSSPLAASTDSRAAKIEQARQLPLVRTATQIFNADVVDVQDSPTPSAPTPKKPGSQDDV